MASSPAILPISNLLTISTGESQVPITTPAFCAFINNIAENVRSGLSSRRPCSELIARSTFSKPDSISDVVSRDLQKLLYFRVNYITIVVSVTVLGFSCLTMIENKPLH